MDFVQIDDFLDDVMPECAGCTEFLAEDRIRWAAIEFCRKSLVSQETTEGLDLTADEPILELPSISSNVLLYRVLWMRNTKQSMTVSNRQSLANRNIRWDLTAVTEYPPSYVQLNRLEVQLFPTPEKNKSEEVEFHAAYIPSRKTTRLDAILIDEHREAIVAGALSKILNMSKESWYSPVEAKERSGDFYSLAWNARAAANKDFTTEDMVVQSVFFA